MATKKGDGESGESGESEEYSDTSSGEVYKNDCEDCEDDDDEDCEDCEDCEDDDDEDCEDCEDDDDEDCEDCEDDDDEPSGGFFNKHDEENSRDSRGTQDKKRREHKDNKQGQSQKQDKKDKQSKQQHSHQQQQKQGVFLILKRIPEKRLIKKTKYNFYKKYNDGEKGYFDSLTTDEKNTISMLEDKLESSRTTLTVPIRFKVLDLEMNERTKRSIIFKLESINRMSSTSGEYHKINNWLCILNEIPFNRYYNIPVKNTDGNDKICVFLSNIRERMNKEIYGHKDAKEQIVRVLAQLISFPKANGYIIGIQGAAGIGKTKLIKEGICNALNYPNAFISLSGTDDASFLRGHSYTYEGATYGKICESLIKTGIMNPLLLFDELDKVSNTYKGQEIINTLIHITDPVQNDRFNDRYFEEIDLDISRSMIVFTFNDESLINPILKDRMIVINVKGYNNQEKLVLAKDYIIPEILLQYNLTKGDIRFSDEVLTHIIETIEAEEGVRNLKRAINNTISWINMMRYVSIDNLTISLPYDIGIKFYDKYCATNCASHNMRKDVLHSLYN
jgi:ATP-dependent Lon protease